MPRYECSVREFLGGCRLDYILGSVHFLEMPQGIVRVWDYEEVGQDESLMCYWRTLAKAVNSGVFDALAHPDLVLRSGVSVSSCTEMHRRLIRLMKARSLAYEVNCSGWRKTSYARGRRCMCPDMRPYPCLNAAVYADACCVPLVMGSDAHSPEEVGAQVGNVMDALRDRGVSNFAYYERRNPRVVTR